MASSPIPLWEIDGETVETLADFIFGGSKITADGDCSHEIKRHLLLGRKVMTNLDSILKSRDIPLPTKVRLVKAMVFPVVMYGCASWTVKKAECQRIDAFELWCWRRLLRVPWTTRRSNQSILKEISPGISLEGMMLKLKLQYFGHLIWRVDSLEKTLMLGGIGGKRRRGRQRMRWLNASLTRWMWVWVNSGNWWWAGRPGVLGFIGSQRVGRDWVTELNWKSKLILIYLHWESRCYDAIACNEDQKRKINSEKKIKSLVFVILKFEKPVKHWTFDESVIRIRIWSPGKWCGAEDKKLVSC